VAVARGGSVLITWSKPRACIPWSMTAGQGARMVELVRLYSSPDVRGIVAHAAQAVTRVKLDHYSAASPLSARRHWRLVDRLGEQIIHELLTDSRAGTQQRELAERYDISVSSVKRILRH
jgi:hypothetical protein